MLKLSDNLDLPIDFVTERIAFLARTGAGKSGGMRVLFEQMLEAGQFCVFIDPKGDAWGIRAAGDGEGKPVLVIGGDHADIPLEPTAGTYIAEFLVRERVSTVLDMSDLSTQQMWRFVSDLGSRMYKLNRDIVHIFIDEADMIAGQQFFDPHCLHAIQLIQNKGRGRGFGMTIATQRPQILNKTVLNASGTLIAMQTIGDDALKVVKSWLGQTGSKEVVTGILSELPTLQNREAFVYSPQTLGIQPVRIRFASFQTFDSMRTPKPGEARQTPKSVADIDLTAIKSEMSATIAEAKANDPAELKKQIKTLERELANLSKSKPAGETVEVIKEVPVLDEDALNSLKIAVNDLHQREVERVERLWDTMKEAVSDFGKDVATGEIYNKLAKLMRAEPKLPASNEGQKHATPSTASILHKASSVENRPKIGIPQKSAGNMTKNIPAGEIKINPTQQRILDALAFYESIGNRSPSLVQIGAVALIDPTGGHFSNTVGPLSSQGLIERSHGRIRLTDEGKKYANLIDAPNSLEDYHRVLRERVRKMKSASGRTIDVLNVIIEADGQSITTEAIGKAVGIDPTGGHFSNTIGPLSTAGLISRSSGLVTPTEVLFPAGLN